MRAAHAVAPKLAYPPQWHLPTTDIRPLARSKRRRRRSGTPPCRCHARGGGRFPVPLPLRARNRLWFGRPSISEWVDIWRIEALLNQNLHHNGCMGLNSDEFLDQPFKAQTARTNRPIPLYH